MRVVLLALKIVGWLLLGLLLLLVLALVMPACATVRYEAGRLIVRLRVLGIPFTVCGGEEAGRAHRKKRRNKPREETSPQEKPEKKRGRPDIAELAGLLKPAAGAAGFLLRRIRFSHVRVLLVAGGRDAAEVGINTGRLWQAVGAAGALVRQLWRPQVEELTVLPDFLGEYAGRERVSFRVTAMPVSALAAGILLLTRYLKIKRTKTAADDADTAQQKENAEDECKSA